MIDHGLLLAAVTGGQPRGTNLVVIANAGPPSPLPFWISLAIGAALVLTAAAQARRSDRVSGQDGPTRSRRILLTACAWAIVVALMAVPEALAGYIDDSIFIAAPLRIAALLMLAVSLYGGLDLLLDYFAPQRSRAWRPVAVLLFAALPPAFSAATGLHDWAELFGDAGGLRLILAGAAAGLIWWSCLPASHRGLTHVFE
ncbi:hypothetical protein [Allosphingosinicella deserti]|uniref:Uncharacterized protein n=1 Tax=Allosphingosinicella deserti TaxID=2116704 RepID=A0A2P7QHS0_9SPHN|nr:hypothetical protein [Sphingomonas deserti]PSJ37537.1 hypothetical protein C7I55_20850 [Sphingomonas deserti]